MARSTVLLMSTLGAQGLTSLSRDRDGGDHGHCPGGGTFYRTVYQCICIRLVSYAFSYGD